MPREEDQGEEHVKDSDHEAYGPRLLLQRALPRELLPLRKNGTFAQAARCWAQKGRGLLTKMYKRFGPLVFGEHFYDAVPSTTELVPSERELIPGRRLALTFRRCLPRASCLLEP